MAVELTGMTWAHSRGYSPIVAVTQRYEELHPNVRITWEKRSLADFENQPVNQLAERYDFLVIDHPWTGFGLASGVVLPLEGLLPRAFLQDQAAHSAGRSYESYTIAGHQLALPIDAATPIAVYRPDVMERLDTPVPTTWEELLTVAGKGHTILAAAPLYTLLDFFMFCATIAGGEDRLYLEEEIAPREIAEEALERQRELTSLCPELIFRINPIEVHELMSGDSEEYGYCPFVFGYVNYFRPGYSRHVLKAANVVAFQDGLLKTTLGGTGLALSSRCRHLTEATDFMQYALSEDIQKTLYFDAGGQPGYSTAWADPAVNRRSNGFFENTWETICQASMRPRYNGYMELQDHGGEIVREYLKTGRDLTGTLEKLNVLYRKSRRNAL